MSVLRAAQTASAGLPATLRVWNQTDNWCSLCKEPFGQWNEHRGKRDHICLELFFETVLDFPRLWSPGVAWASYDRTFSGARLPELFRRHDGEERARREAVFQMVRYLRDERAVVLAPTRWREPAIARISAGLQGALVMYKWMHPHILHLFPRADAKQISALSQMCASMYNLETTFDVCGLKDLIEPGDLPATAQGEPGELDYATKAFILRNLLGQLRWAMDLDTAIPKHHSVARACPPHVAVVAEKAGHALITDMIFCRVCEYVSRVEPVWREKAALLDSRRGTFVHPDAAAAAAAAARESAHPRHLTETPRSIIGRGLGGGFSPER